VASGLAWRGNHLRSGLVFSFWEQIVMEMIAEILVVLGGWWVYVALVTPKDKHGPDYDQWEA
jgi:hypothetical protein